MTSPVTLDSKKSLAIFSKLRESFHSDGTEIKKRENTVKRNSVAGVVTRVKKICLTPH
jgi:hypothetical protein